MIKFNDNEELMQLEVFEDDREIGRIEYFIDGDDLLLTLIYVEEDFRGQGKTKHLVKVAYDWVKQQNKQVEVTCSVLKGLLLKDDEYKSIVK